MSYIDKAVDLTFLLTSFPYLKDDTHLAGLQLISWQVVLALSETRHISGRYAALPVLGLLVVPTWWLLPGRSCLIAPDFDRPKFLHLSS